jgi:hypothetical protein
VLGHCIILANSIVLYYCSIRLLGAYWLRLISAKAFQFLNLNFYIQITCFKAFMKHYMEYHENYTTFMQNPFSSNKYPIFTQIIKVILGSNLVNFWGKNVNKQYKYSPWTSYRYTMYHRLQNLYLHICLYY